MGNHTFAELSNVSTTEQQAPFEVSSMEADGTEGRRQWPPGGLWQKCKFWIGERHVVSVAI
jgi:hypothetical protein